MGDDGKRQVGLGRRELEREVAWMTRHLPNDPKALVIVPWKSSQLADMPSVSRLLDSATQPVDKDVFMRELSYYEFKSSSK